MTRIAPQYGGQVARRCAVLPCVETAQGHHEIVASEEIEILGEQVCIRLVSVHQPAVGRVRVSERVAKYPGMSGEQPSDTCFGLLLQMPHRNRQPTVPCSVEDFPPQLSRFALPALRRRKQPVDTRQSNREKELGGRKCVSIAGFLPVLDSPSLLDQQIPRLPPSFCGLLLVREQAPKAGGRQSVATVFQRRRRSETRIPRSQQSIEHVKKVPLLSGGPLACQLA